MSDIVAVIQARMGSTRFPGKVMKEIHGYTILSHVISRVKQTKLLNRIIIATTTLDRDDIIIEEAKSNKCNYYRGSEKDVLRRYYYAAKNENVDVIVRITSDCPLIDPFIINEIVEFYISNKYDLVTNAGNNLEQRTYPRGLDVEVFSYEVLEEAFNNAKEKYQREHVTPYIYENKDNIYYYKNEEDYSQYRLTLDEEADWELIKKIYYKLYNGEHNFYFDDIIKLLKEEPDLKKINENIEQKKIR